LARLVGEAARSSAKARLGSFFLVVVAAAVVVAVAALLSAAGVTTPLDGALDVMSSMTYGAGFLWGSSRRDRHHPQNRLSHGSKSEDPFRGCERVRHALLELQKVGQHGHEHEPEHHEREHHRRSDHGHDKKEGEEEAKPKTFHGKILYPDSRRDARDFAASIKVWNERYNSQRDHHLWPPCAAVVPSNEADVALIVPILVQHGANIVIKSGGHCYADYSSASSGDESSSRSTPTTSSETGAAPKVVLDLVHLNDLHFDFDGADDPNRDTVLATMGPGTTMGQILHQKSLHDDLVSHSEHSQGHHDYHREDDYYYAGVLGSGSEVAAGGYILGGGYGYWSRKHGLAIDNVRFEGLVFYPPSHPIV
jgi:hypothetical protein